MLPHEAALVQQARLQNARHARGIDLAQRLERRAPHVLARIVRQNDQRRRCQRVAHEPEGLDGPNAHTEIRVGNGRQKGRNDLGGRQPRQRLHGAFLDAFTLVAQERQEQHGGVLVAQAPYGRGCLGAHLRRGIVDQGRHQSRCVGRPDPGQAADGPLAYWVGRMIEPRDVRLLVLETDANQRVGRVVLERRLSQELDQLALRTGLTQPAESDRGRLAVVDVIVG